MSLDQAVETVDKSVDVAGILIIVVGAVAAQRAIRCRRPWRPGIRGILFFEEFLDQSSGLGIVAPDRITSSPMACSVRHSRTEFLGLKWTPPANSRFRSPDRVHSIARPRC